MRLIIEDKGHILEIPGSDRKVRTPCDIKLKNEHLEKILFYIKNIGIQRFRIEHQPEEEYTVLPQSAKKILADKTPSIVIQKVETMNNIVSDRKIEILSKKIDDLSRILYGFNPTKNLQSFDKPKNVVDNIPGKRYKNKYNVESSDVIVEEIDDGYIPNISFDGMKSNNLDNNTVKKEEDLDLKSNIDALNKLKNFSKKEI